MLSSSHVRVTHELRDGEGIKTRFTKPRPKRGSPIMPDEAFDPGQLTRSVKTQHRFLVAIHKWQNRLSLRELMPLDQKLILSFSC